MARTMTSRRGREGCPSAFFSSDTESRKGTLIRHFIAGARSRLVPAYMIDLRSMTTTTGLSCDAWATMFRGWSGFWADVGRGSMLTRASRDVDEYGTGGTHEFRSRLARSTLRVPDPIIPLTEKGQQQVRDLRFRSFSEEHPSSCAHRFHLDVAHPAVLEDFSGPQTTPAAPSCFTRRRRHWSTCFGIPPTLPSVTDALAPQMLPRRPY